MTLALSAKQQTELEVLLNDADYNICNKFMYIKIGIFVATDSQQYQIIANKDISHDGRQRF